MKAPSGRFSAKVHVWLIVAMMVAFILLLQQWSFVLFKIGLLLLIVTILVQIPFGNIPAEFGFGRSIGTFFKYFAVLVAVFVLAMFLAPYLVKLGGA